MNKRLLIIDGQSDSGGPNITVEAARQAVGHLYGSIQRLAFEHPVQLIAELPRYAADRVLTAGHGGRDGPNARGVTDRGSYVRVSPFMIEYNQIVQDQLTTTESTTYELTGSPGRDVLELVNKELIKRGHHALYPGEYRDAKTLRLVYDIGLDVYLRGLIDGLWLYSSEKIEPTSKTADLPSFANFCHALRACVATPSTSPRTGAPIEPFFYVGSCYAASSWAGDEGAAGDEPASFADAVARHSGIPTYGAPDQTSIAASLQNLALIERAVDKTHDAHVPGELALKDHVELAR